MLNKYNNIIELLEESGKVALWTIEDGDLLDLIEELDDCGIKVTVDSDYIKVI